jgi:hypothetical protein
MLREREKLCGTVPENQLRPMHRIPSPTIQSLSLTIAQPPHLTVHDGKDQCDEKQQRRQAWTPFFTETLAPSVPQNHLNVFQGARQERIFSRPGRRDMTAQPY